MDTLVIQGPTRLKGKIKVTGAKNVAMKLPILGILCDEKLVFENIPYISSFYGTCDIVKHLGVSVSKIGNHKYQIKKTGNGDFRIPLHMGGLYRTAPMALGPLLARYGKAQVPNPGGCRLGKRPIERHIEGLVRLGAKVSYENGFFIAHARKLTGNYFKFSQNTHTGTESMLLAAVLAEGRTILENVALEPEIDDLISILNLMGAQIKRVDSRKIIIDGVRKLKGCQFKIMSDRNEAVTLAVGALASKGEIIIDGAEKKHLTAFLQSLDEVNGGYEIISGKKIRFFYKGKLKPNQITTRPHPGFMTDWQAPWALLMTQAIGKSIIHETIFEDRFGYVNELIKMGAQISFFNPDLHNPEKTYNFNWKESDKNLFKAVIINGPVKLHNALLEVSDLRAGATLILAAIIADGESILLGIDHIDRGYENIEDRLSKLGAKIKRVKKG
jgi:UDP-N-acetylglucosamine 1-carboxyvinyltransferase